MSEQNAVTAPLIKALSRLPGILVKRIHCGRVKVRGGWMNLGEEGMPDLLVVGTQGRVMWIETKAPDGRLRPSQRAMHSQLRALGHEVRIATLWREGVEHVREWMKEGAA